MTFACSRGRQAKSLALMPMRPNERCQDAAAHLAAISVMDALGRVLQLLQRLQPLDDLVPTGAVLVHHPSLTLATWRELRVASHAKGVHCSAKREGGPLLQLFKRSSLAAFQRSVTASPSTLPLQHSQHCTRNDIVKLQSE
jgi:hypothetical protein